MKKKLLFLCIAILLSISGCGNAINQDAETSADSHQLSKGADVKQLVNDYIQGKGNDTFASITSTQLVVTDSKENQYTYDLPADEFFVSIAPFIEQTHPCATHSLTNCRGEMVEEEFAVTIKDMEGNVVVNDSLTSNSQGFIDLWLPRNKAYTIKISAKGKTAESRFSTFEEDNTCITNMQLLK
ncbi:CueP family metal-binding protein [Caldibacillus lycopersici]|uniref:CueP family metal-binding protein n=1 Tax=Perspicuibacillus lycopersici TaxID=1325689 RepID=A0AAE3LQ60_9BACI|nr:CueP family metal-binding protein [Perspicuibacillus lycopersici]MCU9613089.1 CueP family metal-binding protein [Perspicuibacillus lycopersici]